MRAFQVALTLCLAPVPLAHAGADYVVIPGGVADAAGKVGYLSMPKGGVVAVDLTKGEVLWESKDANRVLAISGKRLATLAPLPLAPDKVKALRVLVIDLADKGKKLVASEPIILPDWAVIGLAVDRHEMGKGFTARARMEKDKLAVYWSVSSRYWGGARPTEEIIRAASKDASGVALIDLESGKIEAKTSDKPGGLPMTAGLVEIGKLPKDAQEIAKREGWQACATLEGRAFGKIQRTADGKKGFVFGGVQVHWIQALDLATNALVWERPYEEQRIIPPPP